MERGYLLKMVLGYSGLSIIYQSVGYAMILIDTLDFFPKIIFKYQKILQITQNITQTLKKYQDAPTITFGIV